MNDDRASEFLTYNATHGPITDPGLAIPGRIQCLSPAVGPREVTLGAGS